MRDSPKARSMSVPNNTIASPQFPVTQAESGLKVWQANDPREHSVWLEIKNGSVRLALGREGKLSAGARFVLNPQSTPSQAFDSSSASSIVFDGPLLQAAAAVPGPGLEPGVQLERLVWLARSASRQATLKISMNAQSLEEARRYSGTENHAWQVVTQISALAKQLLGDGALAEVALASRPSSGLSAPGGRP